MLYPCGEDAEGVFDYARFRGMGGSGKGDPDMPASIQGEPENRRIITYRDCEHLSDGKSIKVVLGGHSFFPDWLQKIANSGTRFWNM